MKARNQGLFENGLTWQIALLLGLGAIISFQLAYSFVPLSFLIAAYLGCLFQLAKISSSRQAFYLGLGIGLLTFGPQLNFMWTIFGTAAIALWLAISFWIALFLLLSQWCQTHFNKITAALLVACIWTGLEYFRSELYYLRFSWLNIGYVFADHPGWLPLHFLGVYGIGFVIMTLISACSLLNWRYQLITHAVLLIALALITHLPFLAQHPVKSANTLRIAGVQMEFPSEQEVIFNLNRLIKKFPEAELIILSEYTFDGSVPAKVLDWCRHNHRYLAAGGKDSVSDSQYYNTVFVVSPAGKIIFQQAKSVPIQFFNDGLPAPAQKLWESPWGKIGFCICYDLSYSRVTDQLVRLGAQAIIVPTMDLVYWGRHQHELHALIAPARAAEYAVPIFRLASSGISQWVTADGEIAATAPMPGDGAMLYGTLLLEHPGSLPWDRWLAKICTGVTGIV